MINKEVFLKQLNNILSEYETLKSKSEYDDLSGNNIMSEVASLIAKSKAVIVRIAGDNSEYYKAISTIYDDRQLFHNGLRLVNIAGVINALKDDLENDFLVTLNELAHAELFADYIEMAEYLLGEGYKDSAAVIAGSTLESHIRTLCKKHGVEIETTNSKGKLSTKKADTMNADLGREIVYNKTVQKQITAWLALRNDAAHGNYNKYSGEEVKLFIQGIRNFMIENVA